MISEDDPFPIPFAEALAADLPEDVPLPSPSVLYRLETVARLLLGWNSRFNLTAIRDPRQIVRRHFAEPLAALPFLGKGRLLDLGTGAGFPGLPLHLARGVGELVLVEASEKKCSFLEAVVGEARVTGVTILQRHARRVEDLQEVLPLDSFTMRAIPEPGKRVGWLPRLLKPKGVGLLFLGQSAADLAEIDAARLGLRLLNRRLLPGSNSSWLVVLQKPE